MINNHNGGFIQSKHSMHCPDILTEFVFDGWMRMFLCWLFDTCSWRLLKWKIKTNLCFICSWLEDFPGKCVWKMLICWLQRLIRISRVCLEGLRLDLKLPDGEKRKANTTSSDGDCSDYSCTTGWISAAKRARGVTDYDLAETLSAALRSCVSPCWHFIEERQDSDWGQADLKLYFSTFLSLFILSCLTDSAAIHVMATLSCWSEQQRSSQITHSHNAWKWHREAVMFGRTSAVWRRTSVLRIPVQQL